MERTLALSKAHFQFQQEKVCETIFRALLSQQLAEFMS
jgi:hypothetical protein